GRVGTPAQRQGQRVTDTLPPNAIAIIGMSGRFPGAGDAQTFWRNLCAGLDSITHFTDAEIETKLDSDILSRPNFVHARPVLDHVEMFDADFFAMPPREAALTDPQHRIFLECCWEALEDGACDPSAYGGAIGVFAGAAMNTYFLRQIMSEPGAI